MSDYIYIFDCHIIYIYTSIPYTSSRCWLHCLISVTLLIILAVMFIYFYMVHHGTSPCHVEAILGRHWGSRYYVKHRAHNERGPSTWPSRGRGRSRLNVHAMVHCMWMSCIVFEWITMVFRCCLLLIQVWPHHCRIKLVLLCFTPLIPKGSKGLVLWQGCQPKWAMTKLDTSPIGPQTSYRARSKHGICRRPSLRQPGFLSQWMTPVEIDTYITIHNYPLAIGCSFL